MEMPLGKGQVARFWTAKEKNQTEDKLGSRKLDKLRNRVEKKKGSRPHLSIHAWACEALLCKSLAVLTTC